MKEMKSVSLNRLIKSNDGFKYEYICLEKQGMSLLKINELTKPHKS